jgi:hypothetical protein
MEFVRHMKSFRIRSKRLSLALGAASLALMGATAQPGTQARNGSIAQATQRCEALTGAAIPASAFGLPAAGASVTEATIAQAGQQSAYCRVRGSIQPAKSGDLQIHFQLNLPTDWNGKAVQFGGGGSNGVVIEATGGVNHSPAGTPTPLMRGYATYGGDSGHAVTDKDWVLNDQAYANFAGESVKRTRDAAVAIIRLHYGRDPRRTYFVGGSKGGHEGLVAAQRYGADYDGVISYYPAARALAMQMSWGRMGYAASAPGAGLTPAQQQLVKSKVLATCDGLDGATDGLISNIGLCRARFSLQTLRCRDANGRVDSCLTGPQIDGLRAAATPLVFDFPLANGVRSIGPYPVLEGADFGWLLYPDPANPYGAMFRGSGDDIAKQVSRDPSRTLTTFDYRKYRQQVQRISTIYDASDPDLDRFRAGGGKLLLAQGTTDMLVPADMTHDYFRSLRARYGTGLDQFVRYYVQPGFGHGSGDFQLAWDSLAVLERWVEAGESPGAQIATDEAKATVGRTRPLCEYPAWPRYRGKGSLNAAASFICAVR